jgi:hypothetical protein
MPGALMTYLNELIVEDEKMLSFVVGCSDDSKKKDSVVSE